MDKFAVYHSIKSIQSIVAQYPAAKDVSRELTKLAWQLSSRTYRVAVIGEFKRGKSSLVNCILGTEILPTDILPTTAVVNRIIYGTEQKIEIHYKDGNVRKTSVEELAEYATKKNEMNAASIREIVVHYPAVFCQNNIQLLDTPGLNDDEFMDRTTLDVLDKIDTAIVATHASYPVSETEKKLICRLIEQDDIYHLTFVATFIDRVSDEKEEQDEVLALIRSRLSKDTYQLFCGMHPDEPKLLEKAKRILCEPAVFAVSSRLAMRGFVTGNKKMLDESRFPHFKYELSALLTANQELDLQMKAARLIQVSNENFGAWQKDLLIKLDADLAQAKQQLQSAQTYQKTGCPGLMERLVQVDRELESNGIHLDNKQPFENSPEERRYSRIILRNLLQIEPESATTARINQVLHDAAEEITRTLEAELKRMEQVIHEHLEQADKFLLTAEKKCGMSEDAFTGRLTAWRSATPFPQLDRSAWDLTKMFDAYATEEKLRADHVVELANWIHSVVCGRMSRPYATLQTELRAYIASWRSQLLKQNVADKSAMAALAEDAAQRVRNIRQQKNTAEVNFSANQELLARTEREITANE